ncbi:hypothetical protein PR048_012083 [Dryococelus australis]|uniref:Integrase catalytic domain-containing protein n=1 Tax=Dryococelus australis TaxID=614101 RepID=A0ABQ9HNQ4_9NEOP|nr:hypothetical protein PR048_012083 [Dryococelus australis]
MASAEAGGENPDIIRHRAPPQVYGRIADCLAVGKTIRETRGEQDKSKEQPCQGKYKLPKIELKSYGGDLTQWLGFRIESSLTEELLRAWQCSWTIQQGDNKLNCLMDLLKRELEQEERISHAVRGFHLNRCEGASRGTGNSMAEEGHLVTATCLVNTKDSTKATALPIARQVTEYEGSQDLGVKIDYDNSTIQVLVGADVVGRLLSGEHIVLKSGLVTINTYLGWEVMDRDWKREGIIEEFKPYDQNEGHYLPHRPVLKDHDMTKVRPVCRSPFLLGAVIEQHLKKILCERRNGANACSEETASRLQKVFYAEKCVTTVGRDTLRLFLEESTQIFQKVGFDLRGWEFTDLAVHPEEMSTVLVLLWSRGTDTLSLNVSVTEPIDIVSKRKILSAEYNIFDPIGMATPITLIPKLLIQKLWQEDLGWDEQVPPVVEDGFRQWMKTLPCLRQIAIPRVAPTKNTTNPRLEFLGATIAARLAATGASNLQLKTEYLYFWSDSTTVISWIQCDEQWSVFVNNWVQEIKQLSKRSSWRYVPGTMNPVDLASRGCLADALVRLSTINAGRMAFADRRIRRNPIYLERKTSMVASLTSSETDHEWYYSFFSSYLKIIQLIGWVLRFIHSCRCQYKITSELDREELRNAGVKVVKPIQKKSFHGPEDKRLSSLRPSEDDCCSLHLRTMVSECKDRHEFRHPADFLLNILIDMAGPLNLKDSTKVWICIFTCAVYRAVHLEVDSSLSTYAFIQAQMRIIVWRGRPKTVYNDSGTNFMGSENVFSKLDWEQMSRFGSPFCVDFNPPIAACSPMGASAQKMVEHNVDETSGSFGHQPTVGSPNDPCLAGYVPVKLT